MQTFLYPFQKVQNDQKKTPKNYKERDLRHLSRYQKFVQVVAAAAASYSFAAFKVERKKLTFQPKKLLLTQFDLKIQFKLMLLSRVGDGVSCDLQETKEKLSLL